MNLLAKIRSWKAPEPAKRTVRFDSTGFEIVVKEEATVRVLWASVVEVAAFKRDLFSIDEICFGFRREGEQDFWRTGEEDNGFKEFQSEVEKRFIGIRTDWFPEVAHPAFRENWTSLWKKPATEAQK